MAERVAEREHKREREREEHDQGSNGATTTGQFGTIPRSLDHASNFRKALFVMERFGPWVVVACITGFAAWQFYKDGRANQTAFLEALGKNTAAVERVADGIDELHSHMKGEHVHEMPVVQPMPPVPGRRPR